MAVKIIKNVWQNAGMQRSLNDLGYVLNGNLNSNLRDFNPV
jgi:hypothetical protein